MSRNPHGDHWQLDRLDTPQEAVGSYVIDPDLRWPPGAQATRSATHTLPVPSKQNPTRKQPYAVNAAFPL